MTGTDKDTTATPLEADPHGRSDDLALVLRCWPSLSVSSRLDDLLPPPTPTTSRPTSEVKSHRALGPPAGGPIAMPSPVLTPRAAALPASSPSRRICTAASRLRARASLEPELAAA